jgi:hypothetical protein
MAVAQLDFSDFIVNTLIMHITKTFMCCTVVRLRKNFLLTVAEGARSRKKN